MALVNPQSTNRYEEAKAELTSLVRQTARVGAGLLAVLFLTGGNPPPLTVALTVVGGIAFVAWSEQKRLTRRSQLSRNPDNISVDGEAETLETVLKQLLEADTENLSDLVKNASLNPERDLVGANLVGVKGMGCNLSRFNLERVDLSHADLRRADLSDANLRGANLNGAQLCRAELKNADLREALLMDADLSYADLSGANLRGADSIAANLSRADLRDADLRQANLTDTNLSAANVKNARFGENAGLSEGIEADLKRRGAIFPEGEPVLAGRK